ncbi:MAG: HAD family hydrolase [Thermoplasmata archaeon]
MSKTDRNVKAILFDLDNTLVEFIEAKITACKAVVDYLDREDHADLLDHFFRGCYSIEDPLNIKDYLIAEEIYEEDIFQECSRIYHSVKLDNVRTYPGVTEVLESLKKQGVKLALVTDAERGEALKRLRKAGIEKHFDLIVTFDTTGKKKPDLAPYFHCLDKMGLKPEEVVMVGDSLDRDIMPGKKLGMLTVHAKYGDRNHQSDEVAHRTIDDIWELMDVISF